MPEKKQETIKEPIPSINEGMTQISKEELGRLQDQSKQIEDLRRMVLETADKNKLLGFFSRTQTKELPIVKLRQIDGKVIISWSTVKDVVEKDEQGRRHEDQVVRLIFEDGTSKEYSLRIYNQTWTPVYCHRTGVTTSDDGKSTIFKLKRDDNGKEYSVDVTFCN